jgi:hypothetical protein
MMKRILCALALVLSFLGFTAQSAFAATEPSAASTAVSRLLADYNGALFSDSTVTCSNSNSGGNCWWWAANVFMALITYEEDNLVTPDNNSQVYVDLATTYRVLCGVQSVNDSCPVSAFTTNTNGNTYFDDIGWWEQAWINAYKWTGNKNFLSLAEGLWSYVTANGWTTNCGSGVVQYVKTDGSVGTQDADANSLYLRDSAWLYSITLNSKYLFGNSFGQGGAFAAASFIRGYLIYHYNSITLGNPGAYFMIADHPDPASSCSPKGAQSWLQAQGEMVNAWTDMYAADEAYCDANGGCPSGIPSPSYFNNLADELARSVIHDEMQSNGTWPFEGQSGQLEPTVDQNGILSEPCSSSSWPYGCNLIPSAGPQWYLISKGFFERGIYCSNHNFNDSTLTSFASRNAGDIANLPHFGFLWDSSGANDPVTFPTQTSVLDGLDADLGGSYAMC